MIFLSTHVYYVYVYVYNTHICSQHKLFHYRLEYVSHAPESASMCQILFTGRPIPRLPSDPHSVKQSEISLCVRVFLVSSSALPPSERSKFKRLLRAPPRWSTEYFCVSRRVGRRENIIPHALNLPTQFYNKKNNVALFSYISGLMTLIGIHNLKKFLSWKLSFRNAIALLRSNTVQNF